MSLDDEIRVYERALLRSGQDPRAVAARILGADPERYWLLVDEDSVENGRFEEAIALRAKLVHSRAYGRPVVRFYALPVVTLDDVEREAKPLRARGVRMTVWDTRSGREVSVASTFGADVRGVMLGWPSGADLLAEPASAPVPSAGGGDVTLRGSPNFNPSNHGIGSIGDVRP